MCIRDRGHIARNCRSRDNKGDRTQTETRDRDNRINKNDNNHYSNGANNRRLNFISLCRSDQINEVENSCGFIVTPIQSTAALSQSIIINHPCMSCARCLLSIKNKLN